MNLPFFIARKYFLSKKKKNFINVISIISMGVVAIGTACPVSYTHLRAHETKANLVCRLRLEIKKYRK